MRKNIAAVTVLYNPDKNFLTNINSYAKFVSLLIVIDNSENPDLSFHAALSSNPLIKIITYNENKGIASALNDGINMASQSGFEWVLTMDQDSSFEETMLERYLSYFERMPEKSQIAAFGPAFEGDNLKNQEITAVKVASVITSGSLVNVSIFNKIGGFDNKLFIDEVDHEYCYRAGSIGFTVFQLPQIYLQHRLGKQVSVTGISGKKNMQKTLHSPLRLYYIVRNSCHVISRYRASLPVEMKIKRKDVLVRIKNNFLYGNSKIDMLKYVVRGFVDYKRGRFGKY